MPDCIVAYMFLAMEQNRLINPDSSLAEHMRELSRMAAELRALEGRGMGEQIIPGEVAYRDARDTYHHITLGAVLAAHGLAADDARRLDGLLSLAPDALLGDETMLDCLRIGMRRGRSVGEALSIFLDRAAPYLEDRGRHAEWHRRYLSYIKRTESFFAAYDDAARAAMLRRPPSRKQLWLVRYTCETLQLAFPELPDRHAAFEWLSRVGANPRYRRIG